MNRRELLKGLMAGGMIVAGELWIPGQKLISIPTGQKLISIPRRAPLGTFAGSTMFGLSPDGQTINYLGPENQTVPIEQFKNWIKAQFPKLMNDPMTNDTPQMVSLRPGYRLDKPEHLTEGTLAQDRECEQREGWMHGEADREYWSSMGSLGDDDLVVDKIYQPDYYSTPAERKTENDLGLRGWK